MKCNQKYDWISIVKEIDSGQCTKKEAILKLGVNYDYACRMIRLTRLKMNPELSPSLDYVVLSPDTDQEQKINVSSSNTLSISFNLNEKMVKLDNILLANLQQILGVIKNA